MKDSYSITQTLVTSLSPLQLAELASKQCSIFYPDGDGPVGRDILNTVERTLKRLQYCFSHVANRYFFDGRSVLFNHLNGDQYAMWLYMLSNQLHIDGGPKSWCDKLFLLNKALHGCDIFYEVELPAIFLLVHPLGTVLGRGSYQDYFMAYQRCGVGSNHGIYPALGKHVTLRPGSAVLGSCEIGNNVAIATESLVLDSPVSANSIYFGNPRDHWTRIKTDLESIWRI
jgi:serine O-acetyltransferase